MHAINSKIEKTVGQFLTRHYKGKGPLLLGFSGGPDSLALFLALKKLQKQWGFEILLAHIDHLWRKESSEEAKHLMAQAEEEGIPFFLKVLEPKSSQRNLEALCRQERLNFFKEIYDKYHCEALVLGHHQDDRAETILKRLLEGASFSYLGSMEQVSELEGIAIWRPLLSVNKSEIRAYLQKKQASPIEDKTNFDPRFLRGRFRTQLIPELSKIFGKEVLKTLSRVGDEACALRAYLNSQVSPFLKKVERYPNGALLDFSKECPTFLVEMEFIIRTIVEEMNFSLSRPVIETISFFLLEGKAGRYFKAKEGEIYVDRKRAFFYLKPLPELSSKLPLTFGTSFFEGWTVQLKKTSVNQECTTSWKEAWAGFCQVILPEGAYQLGLGKAYAPFRNGHSLGKWWANHKVPSFLRDRIPVIWYEEEIAHEFLTGCPPKFPSSCNSYITVDLKQSM